MWIEEFRPETLEDIVGQKHIIRRLNYMVDRIHETGNDASWPHLMFCGPAGVGKTATAIALMRSLFGTDWDANFVELNASDERSINVVRTTVKEFARRGVVGTYLVNGKPKPIPFNVVFLDECDNLTHDAQAALRRTMERYAKQTRFILSCNYPHKIIDPIKDRCAFSDARFGPVDKESMTTALEAVVEREGVSITTEAIEAVVDATGGSMRKALNLLFSVTRVPALAQVADVREIVLELTPKKRKQMLALAIKANKTSDASEYRTAHRRLDRLVEQMGERGYSGGEILSEFYKVVADDESMPLKLQRRILSSIGEALYWAAASQDDLLSVKTFLRRVTA